MSKYLIHERPLTVQPTLIKVFGVEQAIILQQFHWLLNQPRTGVEHDGQRWIWGTYELWCEEYFPFWQARTLRYHINKLQKMGVIVTKALRQIDWDRTNYYTIDYAKFDASIRQHVAPSNGPDVAPSNGPDVAPSNGPDVAPSFKGTKKTTDKTTKKTTESARVDPVARAATPTPTPATPPAVNGSAKAPLLPNADYEMPTVVVTPKRGRPKAETLSPHVKGATFGTDNLVTRGAGANPVAVFYEFYSIYDHKLAGPVEDDLPKVVTDLAHWRYVVATWQQCDNKPTYIKGMLDWYRDPARIPGDKPAASASLPTATKRAADLSYKEWLLQTYGTTITAMIKPESELQHEYKQWRLNQGLSPGI